jgi:hypothetical protein
MIKADHASSAFPFGPCERIPEVENEYCTGARALGLDCTSERAVRWGKALRKKYSHRGTKKTPKRLVMAYCRVPVAAEKRTVKRNELATSMITDNRIQGIQGRVPNKMARFDR